MRGKSKAFADGEAESQEIFPRRIGNRRQRLR